MFYHASREREAFSMAYFSIDVLMFSNWLLLLLLLLLLWNGTTETCCR